MACIIEFAFSVGLMSVNNDEISKTAQSLPAIIHSLSTQQDQPPVACLPHHVYIDTSICQ